LFLADSIASYLSDCPKESTNRVKFLILGEGDLRAHVSHTLADGIRTGQVWMAESVPKREMYYRVISADVCLYTPPEVDYGFCTQRGGSPLKVVDYLSCGRPILLPRNPYYEYVEDHDLGRLYEPGDVHSFCATLSDLLSSDVDLDRCGRNAQKYADDNLRWKKTVEPFTEWVANTLTCEMTMPAGTG
jgi:glycosyltransferase involved in cell wall biosynthesis